MTKDNNKHKFYDVCQDFLVYESKRRKKQGFETKSRNMKLHILPYFKDKYVEDLTKKDIMDWQTQILDKNYSNSFNSSLYYNFSSLIKFCILNSYLEENIVLHVEQFPKKIEDSSSDFYTLREFRKFRRHLRKDEPEIKEYFNFMFFFGTRPSEAMALKFSDFEDFYVNIKHSIHRRGNRELDTPKNKSSKRAFKISLLMWFRIYKLKKYYTKKYGYFNRNFFIFGGKDPLSTTTVDRRKEKACEKAHMRKIRQHDFRHSCITRKIHNKAHIDYVSKMVGHSKVSTTVDIYLHQEKRKHSFLPIRIKF